MGRRYWVLDHCFFFFLFLLPTTNLAFFYGNPTKLNQQQNWTKLKKTKRTQQHVGLVHWYLCLRHVEKLLSTLTKYICRYWLGVSLCFSSVHSLAFCLLVFVPLVAFLAPRFPRFTSLLLWLLLHKTWANLEFAHLKYVPFCLQYTVLFKYSCDQQTFI